MLKFYEKPNDLCKVLQLSVVGQENSVFLLGLFGEAETLPGTLCPATNVCGLMCAAKSQIERADKAVQEDPTLAFALFYDLDFNTFKLTTSRSEMKVLYTDWLSDVVGLYAYLCWPRCEGEESQTEVADQFRGRKFVYVSDFAGPMSYVCGEEGVKLTDRSAKENKARIEEVKKSQLFKDTDATLKNLYVFNVELWAVGEADGKPSKVVDFVSVRKAYLDDLRFFLIDDLIANHVTTIERFLNEFSKAPSGQPSTLTINHQNRVLLKAQKTAFDHETFGTAPRLQMRIHAGKLRNVHYPIVNTVPLKKYLADPNYIYFHYLQDGAKDDGWGCAYRSLQTIFSWYLLNGHTRLPIPTIPEIQQTLVDIGDKPPAFLGSNEWIGSAEISYVLHRLLGVDCQFFDFSLGAQVVNNLPKLRAHFETSRTPVMIGGTVLAWTLLGIAVDEEQPQNSKFLILDPHYKGKDELKLIANPKNKAVYWADAKIFKADARYNFCCPLVKR